MVRLKWGAGDSTASNNGMNRTRNKRASYPYPSLLAGYPQRWDRIEFFFLLWQSFSSWGTDSVAPSSKHSAANSSKTRVAVFRRGNAQFQRPVWVVDGCHRFALDSHHTHDCTATAGRWPDESHPDRPARDRQPSGRPRPLGAR